MSSLPERSPARVLFESLISTGVTALSVCALAVILSSSHSGAQFSQRVGLLAGPVLLVCVAVAFVLPAVWSSTQQTRWSVGLSRQAVRLLLAGPVVLGTWWVLGRLALRFLVTFNNRPTLGGVLMATMGVGIVTFATYLIDLGAHRLNRWKPSGGVALACFIILLVGGVALSVAVGETSGTGSPVALFGVFKRSELDISPLYPLLGAAIWAAVMPSLLIRKRSQLWVSVLGGVSLLFITVSFTAAFRIEPRTAALIQREGGLSATSLTRLQHWFDHDGDGFASGFGGGDCNDHDGSIHPAAAELFDNDVDENCDGNLLRPESKVDTSRAPEPATSLNKSVVPKGLNVLLLTVDTLRFELGFALTANARAGISPELDRLAARSTIFEKAYSLASYTSKSLGPMLIGSYPSATPRSFEHFDRFPGSAKFVQERVLKAGIQTLSIQGYWYFFFKGYGFERGWETLEHGAAPRVVAIEGDRTSNGDKLADDTIMYLKQLADRPSRFFMWTHWIDPHAEYVRHKEHDYGSTERERYDSEVSYVDAQIGRVLRALEASNLADTTAVIVTSDHGEAFAEHGMIRHGFEVWEELVHVPLLVSVPGISPRRIMARRSLIDIAPTILELLEIEGDEGVPLAGKSLLSDVFAPADVPAALRPVLVDMPAGPHNKERRAFYDADHKLIVSAGQVLGLYDLNQDPAEQNDLSVDINLLKVVRGKYDEFTSQLQVVAATK